jgi:hypothetical protein
MSRLRVYFNGYRSVREGTKGQSKIPPEREVVSTLRVISSQRGFDHLVDVNKMVSLTSVPCRCPGEVRTDKR